MSCGTLTDFIFPLEADIFHPIVDQGAYGNVKKSWVLDRSVACNVSAAGTAGKEEVKPNVAITKDVMLIGRIKADVRVSSRGENNSITNVVISNIRDKNCNPVYIETSGIRAGKSTIFEVASQEPYVGPFGNVEYYNVVLRRSENQAVDL